MTTWMHRRRVARETSGRTTWADRLAFYRARWEGNRGARRRRRIAMAKRRLSAG